MQIENVSITSLAFDPENARKHDDKNLKAIKGSLTKFGQQKPIVVDADNRVVAGNGTLAAAKALGWSTIDIVRTRLKGDEAKAFALADNRTAELAEWDKGILGGQLQGLFEAGFDIGDIGFDLGEFDLEKPNEGLTDPDDVPEPPKEPRTKPGDAWLLGRHRLMCGDSTNVQHVDRLLDGEKADMVFTDPPYGVKENTARGKSGRGKLTKGYDFDPVIGDDSTETAKNAYRLCASLGVPLLVFFGANYFCEELPQSSSWLIWDKREGKGHDDNADCEIAWTNRGGPARIFAHLWKGAIKASERGERRVHPTQKPVALAEWAITEYPKSEISSVIDLFLGSGSTLIACEKTGRRCFGMEIDPRYCDVIIERWEKFTGKKAELVNG